MFKDRMLWKFCCCCQLLVALACCVVRRGADSDKQTGTFDSAGVKIAYVEAGEGQPVILVHGLYSSAMLNWELPGTFKMLAPSITM